MTFIIDLKCDNDHKFEGWYSCRSEYDVLAGNDEVTCPLCESHNVENVLTTGGAVTSKTAAKQQRQRVKVGGVEFEDVGRDFPERVRRMVRGEDPAESLCGIASRAEVQALKEEGAPIEEWVALGRSPIEEEIN